MNAKILLVENKKELKRLYQTELEAQGYTVTATTDCNDGINRLRNQPIDLVIVDLRSSERTEMEYLQRIMDVSRDVKVVLNTDNRITEWDFRWWAADALLVQSHNLIELKAMIKRLLPT